MYKDLNQILMQDLIIPRPYYLKPDPKISSIPISPIIYENSQYCIGNTCIDSSIFSKLLELTYKNPKPTSNPKKKSKSNKKCNKKCNKKKLSQKKS